MRITVTAVAVGMVLLSLTATTTLDAFMVPRPLSSSTSLSVASSNQLLVHRIGTILSATSLNDNDDQDDNIVPSLSSDDDNMNQISSSIVFNPTSVATMMSTMAVLAMTMVPQAAYAAGPDWGLFEGRIGSLLHPITMGSLFLFALYTGFLGLQWKRQRTMGDEIITLKKSLPTLGESKSVADALRVAKEAGEGVGRIMELENAVSIETRIQEMQQERKSLAEANPREQHFSQGALLAFVGTAFAIEGPLNTYARAGKLFPGPHLYAGAGLVVLWSLAVSTIPAMQKGNDTARKIHIGANIAGLGLFGWQVTTGLPILFKVVELTKWP